MQPFEEKIKTYTGERITPLGRINAVVEHGNQGIILPLVILKENGPTLLGRNWLSSLVLDWNALLNIRQCANIKNTTNKIDVEPNKLDEILHEYREVFDKSIGTLKNTIVHISERKC